MKVAGLNTARDAGTAFALALRNFVFWESLGLRRGSAVLDIGSGHNPRYFADVICERYVDDDTGRPGMLFADNRLVIGDIRALPFRTDAFDFAVCNHVLEHIDDPAAGLRELARVARAGLVITPSVLHQRLHGTDNPEHRWLVDLDEQGVLVFHPKHDTDADRSLGQLMRQLRNDSYAYRLLLGYRPKAFETRLRWRGSISWKLTGQPSSTATPQSDQIDLARWRDLLIDRADSRARFQVRRAYRRIRYGAPKHWTRFIACPVCHGPLVILSSSIVCTSCHVDYPRVAGRPVLLQAAAQPHGRNLTN